MLEQVSPYRARRHERAVIARTSAYVLLPARGAHVH
jgi:hypothetical protein